MKASEKTILQIKRAINKIAGKFPPASEALPMTDIILKVNQDTGDMLAYDDNDRELNRCVVEDWIGNNSETFFADIQPVLRRCLEEMRPTLLGMGIMKPFTFTLSDEDSETFSELYIVDDDTFLIGDEIMKDLDKDLDDFFEKLMKN